MNRKFLNFYNRNIKIALRHLWKSKLYTFINTLGLSVSLAAIFIIVLFAVHEYSADKFISEYENIYRLNRGDEVGLAIPLKNFIEAEFTYFEEICRLQPENQAVFTLDREEILAEFGYFADSEVFDLLDVEIISGAKDGFSGLGNIYISESMARTIFKNENPVGNEIKFEGSYPLAIAGVFKDRPNNTHLQFDFLMSIEELKYIDENSKIKYEEFRQWGCRYYVKINRSNIDLAQLNGELTKFLRELTENDNWRLETERLEDIYFNEANISDRCKHGNKRNINILILISIGVLVLAIINYTNLAIASNTGRSMEVSIKKTYGASRKSILTEIVCQTLVLFIMGTFFGLLIAEIIVPFVNQLFSIQLLVKDLVSGVNLIFLAGVTLILGIFTGIYPGLYLAGIRILDVLYSKSVSSVKMQRVRSVLIVVQYTVSISLLIGVFTINSQRNYLKTVHPGFDKHQVLYIPCGAEVSAAIGPFIDELKNSSNIEGISQTANIPGKTYWQNMVDFKEERLIFYDCLVDPGYKDALGLELVKGEFIREGTPDNGALVLNEAAVDLLGIDDPIGFKGIWGIPVVGVVKNFNFQSLHNQVKPMMMRCASLYKYSVIKYAEGSLEEAMEDIETAWKSIFPDHVLNVHFLDTEFDNLYQSEKQFGSLLLWFSFLAIMISCIGLFGLTSYFVTKNNINTGVRMVYGATRNSLTIHYILKFLQWGTAGIVIGGVVSCLLMTKWLSTFAYKNGLPAGGIVASVLIILAISVLTVLYHSYRIARQDPVKIFRSN